MFDFSNCKGIVAVKKLDMGYGLLARMSVLPRKERIIIVDNAENLLKIIDINGNIVDKIELKNDEDTSYLHRPLNVCQSTNNEIFITNFYKTSILVFDETFKYINEIENVVSSDNVIDFMHIDNYHPQLIYFSHNYYKKISIFNMTSLSKITEFDVDEPWNIKTSKANLYVVSMTFWDWQDKESRVFKTITRGSNCIFVFDKLTLKLVNKIKYDNWIRPEGLFIDKMDFIFTTAFHIDEITSNVSQFRYLFIFNQECLLIKKIYLEQVLWFADFITFKNKLIFCGGTETHRQWVKLIEFE